VPCAERDGFSAPGATPVDPSPFDLPGEGPAAALCLHGLTGTPWEMRPLGLALAARGVRALGPALPGHNESPERLARTGWREWLAAARAGVGELRSRHSHVFVVGMSMGGLLALALAAEVRVQGVAVVGTPLRLPRGLAAVLPLLRHLRPFARKRVGSDIRDAGARARHPSYPVLPLASLQQLGRLQRRVRALLPRVEAPLLVAHGALDATAKPADAREILAGVGSREKELLILPSSGHVVPVDVDGPELVRAVAEFLARRL
jgi:carboxylesterase